MGIVSFLLIFFPLSVFASPELDMELGHAAREEIYALTRQMGGAARCVRRVQAADSAPWRSPRLSEQVGEFDAFRGVILVRKGLSPTDVKKVFSHELGHAIAVRALGARRLQAWARSEGGWSWERPALDVFDPILFRPYYGAIRSDQSFPTFYSSQNVHEWFAENFQIFALGGERLPSGLRRAFQSLIARVECQS